MHLAISASIGVQEQWHLQWKLFDMRKVQVQWKLAKEKSSTWITSQTWDNPSWVKGGGTKNDVKIDSMARRTMQETLKFKAGNLLKIAKSHRRSSKSVNRKCPSTNSCGKRNPKIPSSTQSDFFFTLGIQETGFCSVLVTICQKKETRTRMELEMQNP